VPRHIAFASTLPSVVGFLGELGWPDPAICDSGNGFHLFYRVDLDSSETKLVKRCLATLSQRFSDDSELPICIDVDTSVHNAARLTKLPGTMTRKGTGLKGRPHRMATIRETPDPLLPVSKLQLDTLAAMGEPTEQVQSATKMSRPQPSTDGTLKPGEDFDARGDWSHLINNEWTWHQEGKSLYRPGKTSGSQSATIITDRDGVERLCVFSSNASPFEPHIEGEPGTLYTKFQSLVALNYSGDFAAAAKVLAGIGYGDSPAGNALEISVKKTTKRPQQKRVSEYTPFPVDTLPTELADLVREGSKEVGCDPSYIALPALSVCASLIGNSVALQVKRNWLEPSVLWTAVVGYSGDKKTPAQKLATEPLLQMQKEAFAVAADEMQEFDKQKAVHKIAMKKWEKKGEGDPPNKPEPPTTERFVVSDTTLEGLAPIIESNKNGIVLVRDELDAWFGSFDRYSGGKGSDVPNWLSTHGAGQMIIDRKTGFPKTIYIDRSAVSISGGIQPGVLRKAMKGTTLACSGLIPRFLFAMPPRRSAGWTDDEMPDAVKNAYQELLYKLRQLKWKAMREGEIEPTLKQLTPTAKDLFRRHVDSLAIEKSQAPDDEAASLSKLEGGAARLALVIQCIEDCFAPVSELNMMRGIELANWFRGEAARIAQVSTEDDTGEQLRRLAEWIHDSRFKGVVTAAEMARNRRDVHDSEEARILFQELQSAGFGQFCVQSAGGRPAEVFTLST
ncbi:YfjI family protein, partial [Planctomycetota bacterium]